MNTTEFIQTLGKLAFNESDLRKIGYDDQVNGMVSAFFPAKRNFTSSNDHLILQLKEEYDCGAFSLLGSISFNNSIPETDRFLLFGWVFGEDPIAIDKLSNEIVTLPFWDFDSIGLYCASSEENFLKAFLIGGIAALATSFENEDAMNAYYKERAEAASIAAGGEKYRNFWMQLYIIDFGTTESNNGALLN